MKISENLLRKEKTMKRTVWLALVTLFMSSAAWAQSEAIWVPEPESGTTAMVPEAEATAPAAAAKQKATKEKPAGEGGQSMVAPFNDRVVIRLNYWTASYNGEMEVDDVDVLGGTATIKGQKLDLDDDLGLENPQSIPEIEIQIKMGTRNRISLSYFTVNYGGEEKLNTNIDLAGYTFRANTDLETIFQLDSFRFLYEFLILSGDRGSLGLSWGMDYYWWSFGYKGTENSSGLKVEEKVTQPIFIPLFGITGNLNIGYGFGLYASYNGISISIPDPKFSASYTNLDCGAYWRYKYLYTGVGYRRVVSSLDAEVEEDEELSMHIFHEGVYWSLGASF